MKAFMMLAVTAVMLALSGAGHAQGPAPITEEEKLRVSEAARREGGAASDAVAPPIVRGELVIDTARRRVTERGREIAAQNAAIAMNLNAAQNSYSLANQLGLAQSYAYANQQYYYEDGVFYIINRKGSYEVIVPPAGALVEALPEDYETLTLGGHEYYRVDDTVYRMVMVQGRPYLEVLGQMYGDMARRYNTYYQYY